MTEQEIQTKIWRATEDELWKLGEDVWAHVFESSEVHYIPLAKLDVGGAPMIEGKTKVVLPDFEVIKYGVSVYAEVKCKKTNVYYRKKSQLRHGIDRRNYLEYIKATKLTGRPCAMAILECFDRGDPLRWSGSLLIEKLSDLPPPFQGENSQEHMCYWPRKAFRDIDSLSAMDLWEVYKKRRPANYRVELAALFATPPTQQTLPGMQAV